MQSAFPGSVVVELRPEGLVGGFTEAVGGKVQWDGEVFVLLDGGTQPLLAMFCKVVVRQKGYGKWNVRLWWGEVLEGFVDNAWCPAAAWFFQICGHSAYGVDFKVCVAAAAELFGRFKGG